MNTLNGTTLDELRASFRKAARKPGTLEDWTLTHVPQLLERLEEAPGDHSSPVCTGRWLLFTSPGAAPVLYTVREDDLVRYSHPTNGYLWYGPIPEAVGNGEALAMEHGR